ncbi:AMP-binding protein, partial [Chitinophaga varians]|uniref:AMP-binding protein n=1 Tax=Chitinophaga varians TaxID=2202339 RepID=UPI00165F1F18
AYVPIDTDYPEERAAWVVKDSEAAALLTSGMAVPFLEGLTPVLLQIDALPAATGVAGPVPFSFTDLAYIIYTSGSTGRPKGVMV